MSATESPDELVARLRAERDTPRATPSCKLALACGRDHHPTTGEKAALLALAIRLHVVELHHGDAVGDRRFAAALLAKLPTLRIVTHPADWNTLGRRAGPIRTRHMLTQVNALAVGPGGRGTQIAVDEARSMGREVFFLASLAQAAADDIERDFLSP